MQQNPAYKNLMDWEPEGYKFDWFSPLPPHSRIFFSLKFETDPYPEKVGLDKPQDLQQGLCV